MRTKKEDIKKILIGGIGGIVLATYIFLSFINIKNVYFIQTKDTKNFLFDREEEKYFGIIIETSEVRSLW